MTTGPAAGDDGWAVAAEAGAVRGSVARVSTAAMRVSFLITSGLLRPAPCNREGGADRFTRAGVWVHLEKRHSKDARLSLSVSAGWPTNSGWDRVVVVGDPPGPPATRCIAVVTNPRMEQSRITWERGSETRTARAAACARDTGRRHAPEPSLHGGASGAQSSSRESRHGGSVGGSAGCCVCAAGSGGGGAAACRTRAMWSRPAV